MALEKFLALSSLPLPLSVSKSVVIGALQHRFIECCPPVVLQSMQKDAGRRVSSISW